MIFTQTSLAGAYIIDVESMQDERGYFARVWCAREFQAQGLKTDLVQCNVAYNHKKGTLRGMHYQRPPHAEVKLVRCTRGAIYDVIVDLRPESSSYLDWTGVELTEENHRMLYVPEGFAHGYVTLQDDSELFYQVSEFYTPGAEGGVRWDDPAVKIEWPEVGELIISAKDRAWPLLQEQPA
ncbi:MAG TPA: dTDP-4-dehydrorhamnose 3,5-epimerase [Gammaproteobacteria bacterium]|nr:dTDP-4-dehydrorhamnose 3,5-epimerase [Gammaproteobacteria bacterium]